MTRSRTPLLLVSVRNGEEAGAALDGGCDILDVKEPARGSLGCAGAAAVAEIVRRLGRSAVPLSAALGETREWNDVAPLVLPERVGFAKLGLAGMAGASSWHRAWCAVRARFDDLRERPLAWVAVAYADWACAGSPPPDEVLGAAIETGCRGVLLDTWGKDGRTLLDWLSGGSLAAWIQRAREANLISALAGRMGPADLGTAAGLGADIIAVRSAACRNGKREGPVEAELVRGLRGRLWAETRGAPG